MASADTGEEQSFKRMWIDAQLRFEDVAGQKLMQSKNLSLDDVLALIDKHLNAQDSDSSGNKKRIKELVFNVLGLVQLLCGVAAQGVSAIFGPATLCFNAVQALISIPKKIDRFYEDLAHLFEAILAFMEQFKIYQRIEQYAEVGIELMECTAKVIIVFVDICALSIDTLNGSRMKRLKRLTKIALFDNDSGVRDKLKELERLINYQGQISDAITLEHVLRSEKDTKSSITAVASRLNEDSEASRKLLEEKSEEILNELAASRSTLRVVEAGMEALQKDTTEKNSERKQQEIFKDLCKKLSVECDRIQKDDPKDFDRIRRDSLPDTGHWLRDVDAYKEWIDLHSKVDTPLLLTGRSGSGKSYLAFAALDDLKRRYTGASSNPIRVLVAFYRFVNVNDKMPSRDGNVKEALKLMAAQIADQNAPFSKCLNTYLGSKDSSFLKDIAIENLSRALIPPQGMKDTNDIFYVLLFDDVDQLSDDLRNRLFEAILAMKSTNIRILFTETDKSTPSGSNFAGGALDEVKSIRVEEANEVDIQRFINQQVKNCRELDGKEPAILRIVEAINEKLIKVVKGSFSDVKRIFDTVVKAIHSMSSEEEIIDSISEDTLTNRDTEIERSVVELQKSLIDQEIEQLNEILLWTIYAFADMTVDVMRAVLTLRDKKPPLQRLDVKVRQRYFQLLYINQNTNAFEMRNGDLEDYFRNSQRQDIKVDSEDSLDPRISMTITVEGVKLSKVQRFFWDLSEKAVFDKFTFTNPLTAQHLTIHANRTESHLIISKRCFDLLFEKPKTETNALKSYALTNIMWHLTMLMDDKIDGLLKPVESKEVVDSLVSLLQYTEYIEGHLSIDFFRSSWLSDFEIDCMYRWLLDSDARGKLDRKSQEWLTQVALNDKMWALKNIAKMIAGQWLCYRTWGAEDPFHWLDIFLDQCVKTAQERRTIEDCDNSDGPVSSDGEHGTMASKNELTEGPMPYRARIHRAIEWADKELKPTKDSLWNERVGDTYLYHDEFEESITAFLRAKELPDDHWILSEKLANAYAKNKNLNLALQEMEFALSDLRGKQGRTDDETANLVENLIQAAKWQIGNITGATDKLREAIGFDAYNYHSHYELLKIFIQTGQTSEALKLLNEMNTNSAKNSDIKQLEAMLLEWLQEDIPLLFFENLFYVVREQDMFHTVLELMEGALTSARKTKANANLSNLLLCLGVARAQYSGEEKRYKIALSHWTESYRLGFECGKENTAGAAAGYAFNVHFSETRSNRDAARELESLVEKVEKLTARTSSSYYARGLRLRLGSYYTMLGRQEAAQKLLLNDMRNGMDFLVDEDPENDYMGYLEIAEILMHTGDDLNALSAWSLYGPSERRKGYNVKNTNEGEEEERRAIGADGRAKHTNEGEKTEIEATETDQGAQDPGENLVAKESQEGEEAQDSYADAEADAEAEETKEYGETKHAEESAERHTQSEAPSPKPASASDGDAVDFYIYCDGLCNKPLTWASSLWKCKVCDDVDFDDECLEKLKKGTLTRFVCSPDHDWLYVPSWVDEYRATGKGRVRIGGELIDGKRSGGRIVSVEEWLDTIRKKWGIEKSRSSTQNDDEEMKEEEVRDGEAA